jgi:GNAT superfamily N-acetyltransferase
MNDASWELSTDPARLQLQAVHAWLSRSYWSPGIRREVVDKAFSASLSIGAYADSRQQVGVARVVTDQATFAWLCDVFVVEDWRGRGIANAMVQALLADPRLNTLRRWALATRDAHEVYRPFGFVPVDAARWLELRPDPSQWQAPPQK